MPRRFLGFLLAFLFSSFLVACGGGGGGGSAANNAPAAGLLASGDIRSEGGQLHASVGGTVRLDASTSSDVDHDALTFEWTVLAKPAGSNLAAGGSATTLAWQPDALGNYTFALKVTDARGSSVSQQVTIVVDNTAPTAGVVTSVQFSPVAVQAPVQAATIGASIFLDASNATDPDGDPVTVSFTLVARPAGSAAALALASRTARFSADVAGSYQVRVQGTDPSGASFQTTYTFDAQNRAPTAVLVANVGSVVLNGGQSVVTTSVGYDVLLDGAASIDADGDTITRAWTLSSRPAGSQAALGAASGNGTTVSPDVLGDYVVVLTVTDSKGAQSTYTTTVRANNRRPVALVTTNATPKALPFAPSVLVPAGTEVTLRGDASADADGDALTYAWSLESKPAGSAAALSSTSAVNPKFTADAEGVYLFRLRVTDPSGAFSDRTISVQVGTHSPVAVVDRSQASTVVGTAVQASAALSFDEDGDALSFQWSVDARPNGSAATIAAANSAGVSFVPDAPGTYMLSVRVSDGKTAGIAYVAVRALAQLQNSVALDFRPGEARYSRSLDRVVTTSASPNALRVVDPFTGAIGAVALPTAATGLNLSPDGKVAVVLHANSFSLVNLQTLTLERTSASDGDRSDAFVSNAGTVYLIGSAGGGFSNPKVGVFNGHTGAALAQPAIGGSGTFYGSQRGVLAPSLNRVFLVSNGLSPVDIAYFDIDPSTSLVTRSGDSPYHGDYQMTDPLFVSDDDSLVFTGYGNYFGTSGLQYRGRLGGISFLGSLSHSASTGEALALETTASYSAAYKRYTGPLLLPDRDFPLPVIGGAQSYGMRIFHSANGSHVVLVQTGSDSVFGSGATGYHVIVR